ncbi:hypothetical protein PUN28_002897 [Cardiocondyla obscurior]|uniref:ADP,ATP carrier protein n=1 Tax=Cardiocondyla obscurior TaxID=286306 RepID=A0AAW2GWM3_9HYME
MWTRGQVTSTESTFNPKITSSPMTNGSGSHDYRKAAPVRLWSRIGVNEWSFSLSLFALSLAVVLSKLYINYGKPLSRQVGGQYSLPSTATFTQMYEAIPSMSVLPKFGVKQLPDSEELLSASNQYAEAATNMIIAVYGKYGWLLKATISGLVITGFSWLILYKDSSIPGVNPPSPFSPSKQRIRGNPRLQLNYLIGMLNGILFFFYMCL